MEGVSQFRRDNPPAVSPPHNPWATVLPSLTNSIIQALVEKKIKESLLNRQMELELSKEGYTPQGQAQAQDQSPGIMDKIKSALGFGQTQAQPATSATSDESQTGLPAQTLNVGGRAWKAPPLVTDLGGGVQLIRVAGQQHVVKATSDKYIDPATGRIVRVREDQPIPPGLISEDAWKVLVAGERQDKSIAASSERQDKNLAALAERLSQKPDTAGQVSQHARDLKKKELMKNNPKLSEEEADLQSYAWDKSLGSVEGAKARAEAWGKVKPIYVDDPDHPGQAISMNMDEFNRRIENGEVLHPAQYSPQVAARMTAARQSAGARAAMVNTASTVYDAEMPRLIELRNIVSKKGLLPGEGALKSMGDINQWLGQKTTDPDVAELQKKTKLMADNLQKTLGGSQGGEWAFKVASDILDPTYSPKAFERILKSHSGTLKEMSNAYRNFGKDLDQVIPQDESKSKPKYTPEQLEKIREEARKNRGMPNV